MTDSFSFRFIRLVDMMTDEYQLTVQHTYWPMGDVNRMCVFACFCCIVACLFLPTKVVGLVCVAQERAEMVFLRYSQRWAKEYVRRHLELSVDGAERGGFSMAPPRHCISARCPCQFIEEHLKYKPRGKCSVKQFFLLPNFTFK